MKESNEEKIAVGFAWYRPQQWQRVRDISDDAEDLTDTYLEWLELAEERFNDLRRSGLHVEKVDVDSEQLILWCNDRGLKINGKSRSRYAAEKLKELEDNRFLTSGRT